MKFQADIIFSEGLQDFNTGNFPQAKKNVKLFWNTILLLAKHTICLP
jgi:hypothetical protein